MLQYIYIVCFRVGVRIRFKAGVRGGISVRVRGSISVRVRVRVRAVLVGPNLAPADFKAGPRSL